MAGEIALGIILVVGALCLVGGLLVWFLSNIDFSH